MFILREWMFEMIKKILLFFTLVLLAGVIVGCGNDGNDKNIEDAEGNESAEGNKSTEGTEDAAAIVNDEVITKAELETQIELTKAMLEQQGTDVAEHGDDFLATMQEGVLNDLISERLVIQAAASYEVSEEEIDEQLTLIKAPFETDEEYEEALTANSLTHELLLERIEETLKQDKYFLENLAEVDVTEEELKALFSEYKENSEEELDYEEIKPMLEKTVVAEKQQAEMEKLLEQLREKADIEILI